MTGRTTLDTLFDRQAVGWGEGQGQETTKIKNANSDSATRKTRVPIPGGI